MTRHARVESAEALHHVTAHAATGRLVLRESGDAERYLGELEQAATERRWVVLSFCLMPNHIHLLLRTPDLGLGRGMKQIQERFARHANQRDGRRSKGHFFRDRFNNCLVLDDHHAAASVRYIARNPVKDGFARDAGQWPHSAHRALAGFAPCPPSLAREEALSLVGGEAAYRALVAQDDRTLLLSLREAVGEARACALALDQHRVAVDVICEIFGISRRTLERRLRIGRGGQVTVTSPPPAAAAAE